jgi:hypothetical protein
MDYDFYLYRGPKLPILLDESLLDMLDTIINPMERPMFNPFVAEDKTFTVEFIKADGSHGKTTGKLVAPNYEGSKLDLMAYIASLSDQDRIPVWTDKGWRSFYASKVIYFKLGE